MRNSIYYKRRAPRVLLDTARYSMANHLKIFRYRLIFSLSLSLSLSLFVSCFLFSNREPISREIWDAIRICTAAAHKYIKLKIPDYSDPISFVYLIQSLRLYIQCCLRSVKNILCTKMGYVLIKRIYDFIKWRSPLYLAS